MDDVVFQAIKTWEHVTSCCFRQWRADSHCNQLHGYGLTISLTFESTVLDHRGWVQDFGGLKPIKQWLESCFDHNLLVAADDPAKDAILKLDLLYHCAKVVVLPAIGCESFALYIYEHVRDLVQPPAFLRSVEVREHDGNAARVIRR